MIAVKLKQCMKCNQTGNSWRAKSVHTITVCAETLMKVFSHISNIRFLQKLAIILNFIMNKNFFLWIDSFLLSSSVSVLQTETSCNSLAPTQFPWQDWALYFFLSFSYYFKSSYDCHPVFQKSVNAQRHKKSLMADSYKLLLQ